jgi:ribosomal protein L11 methyltransferase
MPQSRDCLALSFELRGLDPQRAEAACQDLGAFAVTYSDARDDAVLEPGVGELRLWPATRLQALFAGDADGVSLSTRLAGALELEPDRVERQVLGERAWEREWLRDFHALRFGSRLWICPRHEQVTERGAVVVTLDPGLAFGTGTHPSTALCLEWLDALVTSALTLIDYGSGSGILGIAAARLGAAHVAAFDIDPQALLATAENAAANGVAGRLSVHADAATLPQGNHALLANILAAPLCELAPRFAGWVRPNGQILLAGILAEQAEVVADAYAPWFDIAPWAQREGWVALAGSRISDVHRLS